MNTDAEKIISYILTNCKIILSHAVSKVGLVNISFKNEMHYIKTLAAYSI